MVFSMKFPAVLGSILLFTVGACKIAAQVQPLPPSPVVFAHYMPWFKAETGPDGSRTWEHWQWFGKGKKHDPDRILENGRRDIASVYYPMIGPYDGRDPVVLEYHMLTAKAAGIEGFIADWYGPDTYSDQVFSAMVKAAERYGMTVAICLEEKTFFPGYSAAKDRAEVRKEMARQIRHVLDRHATSRAYYRRNGAPVFFMFNGYGNGPAGPATLSPEELKEVLQSFHDPSVLLVRGHFEPPYLDIGLGNYAWCGDTRYRTNFYAAALAARADNRIALCAGAASPGFDDSGVYGWGNGPRVTDRRGTLEYEENWDDILNYGPEIVQIVTWNDFEEGTTIEPSEQYGFSFVDLTEQYVGRFTGRPVKLTDNAMPLRIFALRQILASLDDEESRAAWSEKLDAYVDAFSRGSRFLMNWKLKRLESKIQSLASDTQGERS